MKQEFNILLLVFFGGIFLFTGFNNDAFGQVISGMTDCKGEAMNKGQELGQRGEYVQEVQLLERVAVRCPEGDSLLPEIAMKYLELGDNQYNDRISSSAHGQKYYYDKGMQKAKLAARRLPEYDRSWEVLSIAFAAELSVSGLRDKVRLADSVRIYSEKALELNPRNHQVTHTLGRWHLEVARLSWFTRTMAGLIFGNSPDGTVEESIRYFKRTIEIEDYAVHRYWLGMAYLEQGSTDLAVREFRYILQLPDTIKNDDLFKEKARNRLEELNQL